MAEPRYKHPKLKAKALAKAGDHLIVMLFKEDPNYADLGNRLYLRNSWTRTLFPLDLIEGEEGYVQYRADELGGFWFFGRNT